MERNCTYEETCRTLQPIIRLLLALANAAEHACTRSYAACAMIVWILRYAEGAASDYADLPADLMPAPFMRSGDARSDAARLAQRFRLLADEILYQAELALCLAARGRRRVRRAKRAFRALPIILGGVFRQVDHAVRAPDTS